MKWNLPFKQVLSVLFLFCCLEVTSSNAQISDNKVLPISKLSLEALPNGNYYYREYNSNRHLHFYKKQSTFIGINFAVGTDFFICFQGRANDGGITIIRNFDGGAGGLPAGALVETKNYFRISPREITPAMADRDGRRTLQRCLKLYQKATNN